MPDAVDRLLTALGACAPAGTDARTLADAVWLAVAAAGAGGHPGAPGPAAPPGPAAAEPAPRAPAQPAPPAAPEGAGVSAHTPGSPTRIRGTPLSLGRAEPLPKALAVGRALQPLRRAWRGGSRTRLDIDATVDHYARGGPLVPLFTPRPERWFEVVVIVDTSLTMSVWDETARALIRLLGGLGAFRAAYAWQLEWAGAQPRLRDHRGTPVRPDRVPYYGSGAQGRRLVLVVSDCTARGWHEPAVWRLLGDWGRHVPVTLVDPLPQRLWRRSALDLPAVRVTAAQAGGRNSALRHHLPLRLRPRPGRPDDLGPWQPLPVATCTPHSLGTWARALMGPDPKGCDAVLVPATGRLPRTGPTGPSAGTDGSDGIAGGGGGGGVAGDGGGGGVVDGDTLAESFLRTASAPAVRLAVLCSHLPELTLPLLHALREQAVPEAELADLAELLTSGLLTVTRVPDHDPVLSFRAPARARLRARLTTHDAWQTLRALSRHLDAHPHAPHGIAAVLHSPEAVANLPAQLQPFAHAAAATQRLLGVGPAAAPAATTRAPTAPAAAPDAPAPPAAAVRPLWEGGPSAARIVAVLGTKGRDGRGELPMGTGFLLGPRLILTAQRLLDPFLDRNYQGIGVRRWDAPAPPAAVSVDCRTVWQDTRRNAMLLLADRDVADAATDDRFTAPRWAETTSQEAFAPVRLVVTRTGGILRVHTGVHGPDGYALGEALPQPSILALFGAPVFQGDRFMGFTTAVPPDPSQPALLDVVDIASLARDEGFRAALAPHLPRIPAKRPARFLLGRLPEPWQGDPATAEDLARDWTDADTAPDRPIVLGGPAAAEKRSYAATRIRAAWDERSVDLVIWASASSTAELRARYAEAEAVISGTVTSGDAEDGVRALFRRLRDMTRPWIVVVDGLGELLLPDGVLPPSTAYGRVVVTGTGPRLRGRGGAGERRPFVASGGGARLASAAEPPGDGPYFFLSYARGDAAYVGRFYDDLDRELRLLGDDGLAGGPPFMDVRSITVGSDWQRTLSRAVGTCRTLVALYSPSYFRSDYCGREFAAFDERIRLHRLQTDIDAPALIPVLWSPLTSRPPVAARYQDVGSGAGQEYAEHGLLHLLRTDPAGARYRSVVHEVARRIRHTADLYHLPTTADVDLGSSSLQVTFPSAGAVPPPTDRQPSVRLFFTADLRSEQTASLARRAQQVILEEGLTTSLNVIDDSLGEQLDDALREGQISILIVVPETARDHRNALLTYDRHRYPTTGVIILEDVDEDVSTTGAAGVQDDLQEIFPRNWRRRSDPYDELFRNGVDLDRFEEALAVMVTVAGNRLMERGTPLRLPSGPPVPPLPDLSVPPPPHSERTGPHDQ